MHIRPVHPTRIAKAVSAEEKFVENLWKEWTSCKPCFVEIVCACEGVTLFCRLDRPLL